MMFSLANLAINSFLFLTSTTLEKVSIKKVQTKKIQLSIKAIDDDILELFVDVEKRWRPNVITKKSNEIPMGINIKSIIINQA